MPKRKRQPEEFDVVEFLRESDDDLKSALTSLLRTPAADAIPFGENSGPDLNLLPTIELSDKPSLFSDSANLLPDLKVRATPELTGPANLGSDIKLEVVHSSVSELNLGPPTDLIAGPAVAAAAAEISGSDLNTESGLNLIATALPGPKKRQFAIREMRLAQDAHTRAEQHVYECLWESGNVYDAVSRSLTIGFGAMTRLVGLSESNARINLRNLIGKLAVEEIAEYNCELSVGRTYRIFNEAEILRRRREAGLHWFMRRTLAVVFVDPATGQPLLKKKA